MRVASLARLLTLILALLIAVMGAAPGHAARPPVRAMDTLTPATYYASVANTGVFKNTNLSGAWQASTTALPSDALALAVGGLYHWRTVYAGLKNGGGVYVSQNGGNTWAPTSLRDRTVYALVVLAHRSHTVLAATDRGVYLSADDGATWQLSAGVTATVTALAQAPTSPSTVYAGGAGAVWVSRDSGRHWSSLRSGLSSHATVNSLAVDATDSSTVYAATSQGLWLERDAAWSQLRDSVLPSNKPFTGVVAAPNLVCAISSAGTSLYSSSNGGSNWSTHVIQKLSSGGTVLAQDPLQPETLLVGDANGLVSLSTDGGVDWSPQSGTVAGTIGSPVLALAVAHRPVLPVDGVPDPRQAGVRWFSYNGGHTLRDPFLTYWLSNPTLIGYPQTEEFTDTLHGNLTAQYFDRMELVLQNGTVTPAPLGLEQAPAGINTSAAYTVDPHFLAFWSKHGGAAFFGPPVSPAFKATNGDGTGRQYLMQYFRNARLEYHPERGTANAVEGGLLGEQSLQARGWL